MRHVLVGRQAETGRLDRLLEGARQGRSGVLVLAGGPGIGKSALCEYAVEQARGMNVLRAGGIESEAELPFAALSDLVRPVMARLDGLPEPQAAALRAAFALGPPVGGDRFTVCAATLSLLAAAAEVLPVLAVVDDAHWLDRSSTQALVFAARRPRDEGVALLFSLRDPGGTTFAGSGLPMLTLAGLDRDAALVLLGQEEHELAPAVADRLLEATCGNPLGLLEVPSLLSAAQRSGHEPIGELVPTSAGIQTAFLQRVEGLPEGTRTALVVAAAAGPASFDEVCSALDRIGVDGGALGPAEEAGLVAVAGSELRFCHPLLRSAVYDRAKAAQKRAVHQALAAGRTGDARVWHLAAAESRSNAGISAELETTAAAARGRGGHAEASAALATAARLAEGHDEKARLLRDAAEEARRAGETARARALLDEARGVATDGTLIARIQHLRAVVEMWGGAPMVAYRLLTEEAERIEATDPARAALLLTDAGWACFMAGQITVGRAASERAASLAAASGGVPEVLATALHGIVLLLTGDRAGAQPLLERHRPALAAPDFVHRRYELVWPAGQALLWLGEHQAARDLYSQVVDWARRESAPSLLPYALTGLAELEFREGAWARGQANATEAATLARETDQPGALAFALAGLARIEAAQGRAGDCRVHATHALDLAEQGVGTVAALSAAALGLLELGLGRNAEASEHLRHVTTGARSRGLVEPNVLQCSPDLIEAHVRAGQRDAALVELAAFEREAEASGGLWARATAARCRGLLASDEHFAEEFASALELHDTLVSPFEEARTALCFGERLRRSRRRREARAHLRNAIERFELLGATPWADRARGELDASGETLTRQQASAATRQLTAQELQVALLAAQGATNREVGAALFLSPKTVEAHLGHTYRKLGIRSRTELAVLIAREETLSASTA